MTARTTVIVSLTVVRAVQQVPHSKAPWVRQLYQKGTLFVIDLNPFIQHSTGVFYCLCVVGS